MFKADDIGERRTQRYGNRTALKYNAKFDDAMDVLRMHAGVSQPTNRYGV